MVKLMPKPPPSYQTVRDSELSQGQDDDSNPVRDQQYLVRSFKEPSYFRRLFGLAMSNSAMTGDSEWNNATYDVVFPRSYCSVRLFGRWYDGSSCNLPPYCVMLSRKSKRYTAEPVVLLHKADFNAMSHAEAKCILRWYKAEVIRSVVGEVDRQRLWFEGRYYGVSYKLVVQADERLLKAEHQVRRLREYLAYIGELETHRGIVKTLEMDMDGLCTFATRMRQGHEAAWNKYEAG